MPRVIVVHYEEDPQTQADYQLEMGDFWDDAINFERAVFLSKLYGWPDLGNQIDRLKEGAQDTGDSVGVYCGDQVGYDLAQLLLDRCDIVIAMADSVLGGNNRDDISARWTANNSQLADFFANISASSWPRAISLSVLTDLMNHTIMEFESRKNQNWVDDIDHYDQAHESAMQWANIIARGIIDYKPEAFVKWTETLVGHRRIHRAIHKVQCMGTGATGP